MARVVGFELSSADPGKALTFYNNVFGWVSSGPNWDYWHVRTGAKGTSGIDGGIALGPADFPQGTRIHIEVASIDESIALAKENGAELVRPRMEFEEFYLAHLTDPVGNGFGLIERKQ